MRYQEVRTIKDYKTEFAGYSITIPAGSIVSNATACGRDNNYRYWVNFYDTAERLTGFKDSLLKHDLTYYGINVPAEYCEKYKDE